MNDPERNFEKDDLPRREDAGTLPAEGIGPDADFELPPKKGQALLSWLVILAVAGLLAWLPRYTTEPEEGEEAGGDVQLVVMELQARYLVGAKNAFGLPGKDLLAQVRMLDQGGPARRLRFAAVIGEMAGPAEARDHLQEVEIPLDDPDWENLSRARRLLDRLYAARETGRPETLGADDREFLEKELGWFGKLALHGPARPNAPGLAAGVGGAGALALEEGPPPDPGREQVLANAQQTTIAFLGGFLGGCFLTLIGFGGLVVLIVFAWQGRLQRGIEGPCRHAGVYAETFALWLVFFLVMTVGAQVLFPQMDLLTRAETVFFLSLGVLAWPLVRGISFARMRQDTGLHLGKGLAVETFWGIACWVMALPLVAVGMIVTVFLILLQGGLGGVPLAADMPTHPILEYVARGDWESRLQVFLLASVAAPLVEETFFRGVLYRQCREMLGRWGRFAGFLGSGLIVSFVFAVIHPQGLVAVPVLMALALGFAIAREWRGSLVAPMVGHALNNALVLTLASLALAG